MHPDIHVVLERQPFHPYTLRLTNGAEYPVREPRQLGAPGDFHVVHWFELEAPYRVVRIDPKIISEIIE